MSRKSLTNSIQDEKLCFLKEEIEQLKNSYKTLNDHSSQITNDISQIKADIDWLKWSVRIVLFGILVSIAITIITSIIK